MTFEHLQHRIMAATALGLLLIAAPGYAQSVAPATEAPTMTSQLQPTAPTSARPRAVAEGAAIRPFRIAVPKAELVELRRRIRATRWPDKETVGDHSQGVPLATMRELARHWATDYDWRKVEAKLNALPQFITEIDGLDIHFIHVRSKHAERAAADRHARLARLDHRAAEDHRAARPIPPPMAGAPSDAFDVVIPSMPGYGFSGKPTSTGWGPERMGRAWAELMKRLGYTRYVAQGGDWGAFVVDQMGLQAPAGIARHPHQHAGHRSRRRRQGAPGRRPGAIRVSRPTNSAPMSSWSEPSSRSTTPG